MHCLILSSGAATGRCDGFAVCIQCESKKIPPLKFSDIFSKPLGVFSPNFTRLLNVSTYAGLQILFNYLQL